MQRKTEAFYKLRPNNACFSLHSYEPSARDISRRDRTSRVRGAISCRVGLDLRCPHFARNVAQASWSNNGALWRTIPAHSRVDRWSSHIARYVTFTSVCASEQIVDISPPTSTRVECQNSGGLWNAKIHKAQGFLNCEDLRVFPS